MAPLTRPLIVGRWTTHIPPGTRAWWMLRAPAAGSSRCSTTLTARITSNRSRKGSGRWTSAVTTVAPGWGVPPNQPHHPFVPGPVEAGLAGNRAVQGPEVLLVVRHDGTRYRYRRDPRCSAPSWRPAFVNG